MNREEFNHLTIKLFEEIRDINEAKGKDYSGDEDALLNFKQGATRFGLTPYKVWGVYAFKHLDAIASFIKNDGQLESEPIKGRIQDAILYLFLLWGLVQENDEAKKKPSSNGVTGPLKPSDSPSSLCDCSSTELFHAANCRYLLQYYEVGNKS